MDKGQEHQVEFFESGEHSWEAVDTAEWALDPVQRPVHGAVILPYGDALQLGRYYGDEDEVQVLWGGFVALSNPVEDEMDWPDRGSRRSQRPTSFSGIVSMLKSFKVKRSR